VVVDAGTTPVRGTRIIEPDGTVVAEPAGGGEDIIAAEVGARLP
jgi:hypothetical protein